MLHAYLQYQTERFFNEQANRGLYNVSDLTEVQIPVNMPGITDWKAYENIRGQIQFENTCYNYVKMKLTHNCMYLMCVPNYEKTHLLTSNIINAKGVKDIPVPKKDHVPVDRMASVDAVQFSFVQFGFDAPVKEIKTTTTFSVRAPSQQSFDIPDQPPRRSC